MYQRTSAMQRIFFVIILSLVMLVSASCASNYNNKVQTAHSAYMQGKYNEALAILEKIKPSNRDRLLFLMDKGMILHAAGEYEESNKILTQAEDLSEQLLAKSISRETAATLWSEEATEYSGEKHEKIMIPIIRMLNYIMLDQWDEALIEVRRLLTTSEKIYGNANRLTNAFAIYLSAIIWETLGQINDALISYSQLEAQKKELPYYGIDISETRKKLGLTNALPPKNSRAWSVSKNYRKQNGELVIISEVGKSPVFVSETTTNILFTVSMPQLYTFPQTLKSAKVKIDGEDAGNMYAFYNMMEDIMQALKDRQKRSFIRKMIKLPVQTSLYVAGDKLMDKKDTKSKLAGIGLEMLALSMSLAEKADERSFRTLPAQFQLGRFYLAKGKHEIEIIPEGCCETITKTVEIAAGKPQVMLLQFAQSSSSPTKVTVPKEPGPEKDLPKAKDYYPIGEKEETAGNYENASYNYMLAYKYGMRENSVAQKVTDNYKKTSSSFKKSSRGLEIASEFADAFLQY